MTDGDVAIRATLDYSGVNQGFAGISTAADHFTGRLGQMGIQTNTASANLGSLGTVLGTVANPMTAVALGITAVGGALVSSVQSAAAWETSMSGVAKTSGLSGEALSSMSQQLLTMSTNMPIAAKDLADLAGAAGSLGVGSNFAEIGDFQGQADAMAEFAVVASQMGIGFGMAAEEAATAGAKILNSFGVAMDSTNLEKLGAVVNTMGDNFAATEPQVLDFLNRASFLNSTFGQTIPQVAALGTTLISTGLDSEVAATGIKSLLNMATSATSKTGGMDNWAKLLGTSVTDLKGKLGTDLNATLVETANKIVAIEDPVERFQAAVALAGSEGAPALLKLAGQQDNYTKALGMSNAEWEKAQSLQKTYEAQAGTVNSQWMMFTNTMSMAATELGTVMLPAVAGTLDLLTQAAKAGIEFGESLSEATGIGQEGGFSAKLNELTGGLMGQSADQQQKYADFLEREKLAAEIGKKEGVSRAEAEIKAKKQIESANEAIDMAEKAAQAKKQGEADAKAYMEGFKQANADREIAKILASAGSKVTAQDVDESLRTFDYLGEQFALKITSHTGSAIGDWYSYSLKGGDTVLADVGSASGYIDPLEAFTMATGLPAPAVGTEAYYRLLGDNIKAEKAKLQEQLKDSFDYSGIGSDLLIRMQNEGKIIGQTGSQTAKDAYTKLLDDFREPAVEKLSSVLAEIETLSKERPLAASEYQLFGEEYKARLYASISDMKPYLEGEMKKLGEDTTSAFSDSSFSDAEKEDLLGMKPWLEYLKEKSPEEFSVAGGDSWLAFIAAIESGVSSGELQDLAEELGLIIGEGAKSGLDIFGKEMKSLVPSAQELINTYTSGQAKDFSKFALNVFQPEMMEEANFYLAEWNTGLNSAQDSAESYADALSWTVINHSGLFTPEQIEAASEYKMHLLDVGKYLEIMGTKTDNAKEKLKEFKTTFPEDFGSAFANWQEGDTSGVFQQGYIGASYGENFDRYLQQKTDEVNRMKEAQERLSAAAQGTYLESGYTQAAAQDQTKTIIWQIEGEAAMSFVDTMVTKVDHIDTTLDPMKMSINTANARAEIDRLNTYIEELDTTMTVQVAVNANATAIQAAVERAITVVLQNVRVR